MIRLGNPARILLAAGFAALPLLPASGQQKRAAAASPAIRIPYQRYTLPNGLSVVLSEDHTTPTVAVAIVFHVGSKNEQRGRTGFAHLFEHVMFTGSGHVPYGMHDKLTEGVGGQNNGSTGNDMTFYYETIPANYLESALWLESDRMGWLLDALDTAKYNAQRDIVKNERRFRVDNQPYGRVSEIMSAAIYPPTNPYSWPVIGSMADLSAATVEDVKAFFRLYYAPNNATLAIVGDFDAKQARAWVQKYFADVPRGKPVPRPNVKPVTLAAEKRLVYEDRVQVPRLYVEWPSVGNHNDDNYALDVLGSILAGPRTARLTKQLVFDSQAAAGVSAGQNSSEDVGEFGITITPRPGHSLTSLELAMDSIVDRVKRDGPTAEEVQRAKAGLELDFVRGLESNLGKGFQLAVGQTFDHDPAHYQVDFAKEQAVTAADVKRVANKYLGAGRVVLSVVPIGKKDQASKPEANTSVSAAPATTTKSSAEGRQ